MNDNEKKENKTEEVKEEVKPEETGTKLDDEGLSKVSGGYSDPNLFDSC